jgi:hypothetical protein
MNGRTEATRFEGLKQGDAAYPQALQDSRRLALSGRSFAHWCDYSGPQWLGAVTCAHCGGVLPGMESCAGNGVDEVAAAHADAGEILRRAGDALGDLAALVGDGTVRLTAYPAELPSLDELAAAVYAIETARAFTHDQLAAFSRIAGDAAVGYFIDGNGACAAISMATAPNGLAVVTVDGEQVATIDNLGAVTYSTSEGEVTS